MLRSAPKDGTCLFKILNASNHNYNLVVSEKRMFLLKPAFQLRNGKPFIKLIGRFPTSPALLKKKTCPAKGASLSGLAARTLDNV